MVKKHSNMIKKWIPQKNEDTVLNTHSNNPLPFPIIRSEYPFLDNLGTKRERGGNERK